MIWYRHVISINMRSSGSIGICNFFYIKGLHTNNYKIIVYKCDMIIRVISYLISYNRTEQFFLNFLSSCVLLIHKFGQMLDINFCV